MFIKWIIIIFVVYYIFRKLIFPIFNFTSTANHQLKQMQDRLKNMEGKLNEKKPKQKWKKDGDYIDYEEIKK